MASSKIKILIQELCEYLPQEGNAPSGTRGDEKILATDISNLTMSDVSREDLDYISSILFQPNQSLLAYLRGNINSKDNASSAVVTLLGFLVSFIEKAQRIIQPYAVSIKNCLMKLASGGSSKIRCAAIETLCTLVNPTKSYLDMEELRLGSMFKLFVDDYSLVVTKTPLSVKGRMMELFGVLIRYHSEKLETGKIQTIERWAFTALEKELFSHKEADNQLVAGVLTGLDHMLFSSTLDLDQDSPQTELLYKSIQTTINLPEHLSRYVIPLAGLTLFNNHGDMFHKFIIRDSESLYKSLRTLCEHQNRDLSSLGYRAMEKLLKEVSNQLATRNPNPQERKIFEFFVNNFLVTLRKKLDEVSFRDLSVAIRGIGYFSPAFHKFITEKEINDLREYLVKISSWFYSESNRDRAKLTGHLPAFIQAYTYFAQSLTNVTPSFMSTIIELVNTFISNYIHLNTITRSTGIFAIRDLLRTLYYKGEGTLRSFLNDFLYNTLITTCTDDHASNYDGQPSYMEFLYFWDVFLNTSAYRSYNNRGRFRQKLGGCNDSKAIDTDSDATDDELDDVKDNEKGGINMDLQSILFDEFLTTLFRLIKTFNLELKKRDDGSTDTEATASDTTAEKRDDKLTTISSTESTDNIEGIATPSMLQAVNEDHFSIFQNLVEFWCMLLPKLNTHRLEHWTYLTASSLIEISLRRPLISGFYKMLSAILNIAHKRKLFDGYKELYAAQQRRKQLGTICDISEIQTDLFSAFVIYRDFLKEVWHRLQQFKDELLASCLRVILAYPLAFFDLSELVEPIRTAFRLGLTVYTLSDIALDVLYELTDIDSNKPDDLNSFLGDILPCMNEYMLMDLKPKREDGDISMVKKWKPTSGNQRKRQAIHYKVAQEAFGAQEAESTVSLRDIQLRVMRFLGRIGGVNKLMLKPITTGTQNINDDDGGIKNVASNTLGSRQQLISWDTKKNLKINLPFPNSKVPLAMDELLPRICELAESSPNRQVKVAACELLHGLMLLMVGDSAFQARSDKKSNESRYHRIYLHVFPILLRLAIDTEPITRDMFSLLVRQLIHWLTNNAQYENPETIALLKACIDATCSTDAGLRDYGADCMQEFVLWSIRQQQGSRTKESSAMNIKSVLKRIYNLASNPSSRQRLGACIIFNRIYRTFREEDALVNEFTLELLYWLFFSLKLAEDDHPLIGTLDQAKEAIGHIRRIIRQKINVFIVGKFGRREFHGIAENPPNLASVVGWAFDETGSIQREYSRECMKFFDEFVGRIPKVKNGKEWLSTRIKNTPELLENAYEHDRCLSVTDMKNKDGILWLQELRAALDGYNWLLKRGMITLMFLLEMPHLDWVEACVYLLDHSAENMFGAKTSIEKSNANALYAYLYHHLVVLITHATDTPMDTDEVLEAFLSRGILANENFISVVVQLLLLPNQFVESAKSEQGSMPNRLNPKKIRWAVRDFLQFMVERGPPRFHRLFEKACSTVLYSQNVDLTNMQLNQSALNDMLQIVDGIKILQELGLFDNICKALPKMSGGAESAYDYSLALYDKFIQFNATTEPVWIRLIGEMLQIAFRQPEFAAEYAKKLLLEQNLTYATQLATYQKFSSHINNCIASNFRYFAPVLLAHSDNRFIHDVIIGLVEYLRREKKLVKREIQVFVKDLLTETTFLPKIIDAWKDPENIADLVKFLVGLLGADPGIVNRNKGNVTFSILCDALKVCLDREIPLRIKSEAFQMIPMYITVSGDHIKQISKSLDDICRRELGVRSTQMKKNSTDYREYIHALDGLLTVMSQFGALWLFEIMFPLFIQEPEHRHRDEMQKHVGLFAQRLGPTQFKAAVDICFNLFKDQSQAMPWRQASINLMIWLFSLVNTSYVVQFYIEHIQFIMGIVDRDLLRRGSDQEVINDMEERMCCFRLMQTMYEKLVALDIHGRESQIVRNFANKPEAELVGRELTSDVVLKTNEAKGKWELPSDNPLINETRLNYHRVAYNLLSMALMRTQKDERFFSGFLFKDTEDHRTWENIVDASVQLKFLPDLAKAMKMTWYEDSIRRKIKNERKDDEDKGNVRYMETLQTTTESLSQVTLIDMALESIDAVKTYDDMPEQEINSDTLFSSDEEQVTIDRPRPKELMEVDQISENPCMKPFRNVIERLHTLTTKKILDRNEIPTEMPLWMKELHKTFTSPATSLHVRLFFAKAIILNAIPFEPYAQYWMRPLMQLVLDGNQYGHPMNYMVHSMAVIIEVWGQKVKMKKDNYNDRYLLYQYVDYLMGNVFYENIQVVKTNIQIIKDVFQNWGENIVVPTNTIYKELATERPKNGDAIGLQLAGIVLAHDMDPFYEGPEVNLDGLKEETFYKTISKSLMNPQRNVYGASAEILGWALAFKKKHGKPAEFLERIITKELEDINPLGNSKSKKTVNEPKFLTIIRRIQINCPEIVQTQMVKVLYLVSQLYGDPRITALQIIAGGSEGIPDLFKSIQSKKLLKTLTRGDDKSQLCLIQILDKIANTLTLSQIDLTVDTIADKFVNHPSVECRHLFFKFIQSVNNTVQKEKDKILGDKLKVLLLQGLVDSSDYIRNSVMAHIKTSYNLGDDIYERLNIVLGNLYLPEVEDKYLLYSTEIILDTTKHGDDYDVAIFKNPLPNAKFDKDYQRIDTSWQLRNPMSPLFVATQEPVWFTQDLDGGVRATQTTFQFSLTQQAAATVGTTLMSSFAPTLRRDHMDIDTLEPGTLYVDLSQQATDDYRRRVGRRRVPPKEATQYDKATERIVNTTADSEAMHYSFVHDRRRKQARRTELLQKQARDKRVTMTRQYRFGELPDVQIRHSELVLPLQVLGRSDNDISRVLHALLSVSISHQAEIYRTKDGYMENIAKITHSNLEKSTEYYPPAIGSFLRICYEMPFAELSSSVIKMASQRSYNENIAIALLERHFLTYVQGDAEHPAKRSRTTKTAKLGRDKKQWIDLAQLYKSIDQPEIFQNLYQSHVASVEGSKVAIDYEIQGRYAEAVNYFVKAHDDHKEDVDPEEVELWMQEMLRCYEQLTEWQDMGAFVNGKFDGKFDTIWDDPEKDEYVKYFMRSYTKMRQGVVEDDGEFTPWTDDYPNPVLKFIASANEVPDRMKYLLHHVACDISLNSIWTNDYDRARFYTRQSYDSLLSVWTSLHPLAVNKRMAQLATLERTVELEDFLDVVSDLQRNAADIDKVTKYIRGLLQKYPDTRLDAMDVWDDIIDSRNLYLDELEGMQRTFKDRIPNQDIINDCKKQILKAMISAAKEQHNVNVLRSRFKRLDSLGIGKEEKVVMILKNRLLMAPMTNGKKEELSLISKMIGSIVKNEAAMKRGSFKHEFLLAAADAFELARRNVQEHPELSFTTLTASGALTSLLSTHKFKDAAMLVNYLNSTGWQYLQDAAVSTMDEKKALHLQCIWKLAQYCDNALTVNEENQPSVKIKIDTDMYSRTVIDSYFKAMELGKTEAIERFPRLLELIERYPANGPEFKMKAESFGPVWMYIRWIPQMVAILDNPIGEYVFPAVYQIAKIYPNALYYAFRISNEHFSSIWDTLNNQTRDRILKIDEAVKSPIMERFIVELTRLTNPEHILGSFVEFIETVMGNGDLDKDYVKDAYMDFERFVMNPTANKDLGSLTKDFAVLHHSFLQELFGVNGSKISKINEITFRKLRNYSGVITEKLKKEGHKKPVDQLISYSPFLSEFQGIELDEELEVPGQYTGMRRPHPEDHARIVNFDQRLLVMSSIRKPKRLRIHGSDERDYYFLVKGGEDLRLDQRIQQLFGTMNDILFNDPYCVRHNVNIRTYKVVPMSTNVGVIEWISDTAPLGVCIKSVEENVCAQAVNTYGRFFHQFVTDKDKRGFCTAYIKAPRDRVVQNFQASGSFFRADILRDYFLRLAASPEAFLYLRDDFAHSLAAVSISGYVLGIGDRHLENFLVDTNSGKLVAIDFGHAFGSATEILQIPELMPFRLTRQLTSVFEPIGISGMLEIPMTHILQAFHDNKSVLLNTMDVFIKEPLLDWRKSAIRETKLRNQNIQGSGSATAEYGDESTTDRQAYSNSKGTGDTSSSAFDQKIAWFPQQKLETARNKLSLENPGYTMSQSVLRNINVEPYRIAMGKVARGDSQFNIRARIGEKCASVQEQVRCLIDLATDPHILGHTWAGWSPTM